MAKILRAGSQIIRAGGATVWYRAGGAPAPVFAYQPKGAASLAASYVNLANPGTYNAAPGNAPTFAAETGWYFGGVQYLTTGTTPAASCSIVVRFSGLIGSQRYLFGTNNSYLQFVPYGPGGIRAYYYGNQLYSKSGQLLSGVVALTADGSYIGGVLDQAFTTNDFAAATTLRLGGANNGGSTIVGYIQATAFWATTLTSSQVAAVSAAMAAL